MDVWEDVTRNVLSVPGVVVGAAALGVVSLVFTRVNKALDRRGDRKAAEAARTPRASAGNRRKGQRFVNNLARRRLRRAGPPRWFVVYEPDLASYSLEHRCPGHVHNLRVDIFTRGMKPRAVGATLGVPLMPPGLPLTMPLGAPSRARTYVLGLRWDDDYGVDQFERLPLARARS